MKILLILVLILFLVIFPFNFVNSIQCYVCEHFKNNTNKDCVTIGPKSDHLLKTCPTEENGCSLFVKIDRKTNSVTEAKRWCERCDFCTENKDNTVSINRSEGQEITISCNYDKCNSDHCKTGECGKPDPDLKNPGKDDPKKKGPEKDPHNSGERNSIGKQYYLMILVSIFISLSYVFK